MNTLLISLLGFSLIESVLAVTTTTVKLPVLSGYGFKDEGVIAGGITYFSMAGGAQVQIQGSMFQSPASANTMLFSPTSTPGIQIAGPGLSPDDEFNSNPMMGLINYKMPSVMTLFKLQWEQLNGQTGPIGRDPGVTFTLSVMANGAGGGELTCTTANNCVVSYHRDYTPTVYYAIPSEVYYGQTIQFQLNVKAANDNTALRNGASVQNVMLGAYNTDISIIEDRRMTSWYMDHIEVKVGDNPPSVSDRPKINFRVGDAVNLNTLNNCDFQGTQCWQIKTLPVVTSVSANTGSTSGGQILTISGHGLNGTSQVVSVDDVPCQVTSSSKTQIVCVTGAKQAPTFSNLTSSPGQRGLRRRFYQKTDDGWMWFNHFDNAAYFVNDTLYTSFETYDSMAKDPHNFGQILDGWFTAPITGKYRFYISCDDHCDLSIDTVNHFNPTTYVKPVLTQIASRTGYTGWRNYWFNQTGSQISEWQNLTAGRQYYIQGRQIQHNGGSHFTVSVEIEKVPMLNHTQAMYQVQKLQALNVNNTFESWSFTVTNPDSGTIKLSMLNPTTTPASYWVSDEFSANSDESTVRNIISEYTNKFFGAWVSVSRQMFDANNVLTTSTAAAKSYKYKVDMPKLISGVTANAVVAIKVTSKSTITTLAPTLSVQSSAPINGSYAITCKDAQGISWSTLDIPYKSGHTWVQQHITNKIPFLADKIEVIPDYLHSYFENGISFNIKFTGLTNQTEMCTISSGKNDTLTGNGVIFSNKAITQYAQSMMFEPVSLEFLSTPVTEPQVKVTINGTQAVCPNLNCDYVYKNLAGSITSQSLTGSSLTLGGQAISDVLDVSMGGTSCGNLVNSSTSITCTFTNLPVAGEHLANVRTPLGLVPNTATKTTIPLVVTSVTPNTNINYLGGDQLTIAGSGFGSQISKVGVKFSDNTVCTITEVKPEEIKCYIQKAFTAKSATPLGVTVNANGVSDSTKTVTHAATVQESQSLVPNSVSPVLKTTLTINVRNTYPTALVASDFTVNLTSNANSSDTKSLYVMSANDTDKTIKVKFGGAKTGLYHLTVSSKQHGRITIDNLNLNVGSNVTSITPLMGSMNGGTLVTINGVNFSPDPLDNPVKVGDNYCNVITSTPTQIKCRIAKITTPKAANDQLVLVFLKTSEEANCIGNCKFSYMTPTGTTTSIQSAFDAVSKTTQITVSGTGLDSPTAQLYLDGIEQTLVSQNPTSAIFTVTSFATQNPQVLFYTGDGIPEGHGAISNPSLKINPTLISISPNVGSAAGSVIQATGSGFGNSTKLSLAVGGQDICSSIKYVSSSKILCTTNAKVMSAASLSLTQNGNTIVAVDSTQTQYSQTATISFTAATINGNTITFTGSNFPTNAVVGGSYNGVQASSGTGTDTSAVLTFINGIPVSQTAVNPALNFTYPDGTSLLANGNAPQSNALTVSQSTTGLTCSFSGGCAYTVTGNGIFSSLQIPGNQINVCGRPCVLNTQLSDSTKAVCNLPTVSTVYSVKEFNTTTTSVLNGTVFPKNSVLADGHMMVDHVDNKASDCEFGMTFGTGRVAVLSQMKFFLNKVFDKKPFVDNLLFQGSNDNLTWTTITTASNEIHEGWNYYKYETNKPSYNMYRFQGKVAGSCRVGEFSLVGVDVINDNTPQYTCTPNLLISSVSTPLSPVTLSAQMTSMLKSISPRFGSVTGGATVTLTGTNFDTAPGTQVFFDGRTCDVKTVTSTQITCVTDKKPYVADTPRVTVRQATYGDVATQDLVFRYVSLYSNPITWGGDAPPLAGESISIPKGQHLLVDVDSTPHLNAIIVEGSLIFPPDDINPNKQKTFDANYILVSGGYMEVGTEQFPYTSKLTITMHGNKFSPYLPIYGNKVIGVRFGTLEMHGVPRPITWTTLANTVEVGATQIELKEATDWKVGEQIVLPTTSFYNNETETKYIKAITGGKTITLDSPTKFKHFSQTPEFGGVKVPMNGEVGLLSRNVVYRGDPVVSPDELYGAHIMCHSHGDESLACRIEYIELTDVGQAFKLGRYPIHLHMIGTVMNSYVRGNAIHHTYNRAVTFHGIHYLRVEHNVAYKTMGHVFFVEDAVETRNYIHHNLVVEAHESFSLLNTDWTPAGFWITHPNNIFINNHVAGTDAYGFWFDMQDTAVGPSFSPNICPIGEPLGEFRGNQAHSTAKYGLRIHHVLSGRENPCQPYPVYNTSNPADPYKGNRPILSDFKDFVGWKCRRNCAITERTGNVHFSNFVCADSGIAGIEFSLIPDLKKDGFARVKNATVIGNTGLNKDPIGNDAMTSWGIIGPRSEGFLIEGAQFFNFDYAQSAALGDCSHCFHPASTDSGARTVRTKGLKFDATTVPRRIKYQMPFRGIWLDLDGSLTDFGANSWAVADWVHNNVTECKFNQTKYGGTICDNTVQVRRIVMHNAVPGWLNGLVLRVSHWDDAHVAQLKANNQTYTDYLLDKDKKLFSVIPFTQKLDPSNSWAVPYVTGHKYRVSLGYGADFTGLTLTLSDQWTPQDKQIIMMTNHTDVRQAVNFTTKSNVQIMNGTYTSQLAIQNLSSGDNIVYNDTATREIWFAVDAKDPTGDRNVINIKGIACLYNCVPEVPKNIPLGSIKYWSNKTTWPNETLPKDGDDVVIKAGDNIVLDLEQTPILNSLSIQGGLTFYNEPLAMKNLELRASKISNYGQLNVGNKTHPFNASYTAKITLTGKTNDQSLLFGQGTVEGGNKVLATSGLVSMYGAIRSRWTRLFNSVYKGNTTITVEPFMDWRQGDYIFIAANTLNWKHSEFATIKSYNNLTGEIVLQEAVQFYHYGDLFSTESKYGGIDIRAEVILMTRNVKIQGTNEERWGCQMLATDQITELGVVLQAQVLLDNVEFYNCSQRDNQRAALRFEFALGKEHTVSNSAFHNGHGWGMKILDSHNINVVNTSFATFEQVGFQVQSSSNINIDSIFVGNVQRRELTLIQNLVDKESCINVCTWMDWGQNRACPNVNIQNSIVAGCPYAGFGVTGHDCGLAATSKRFRNNVAHSIDGTGAHIGPDLTNSKHATCYEGSYFKAYKTRQPPVSTMYPSKEIRHNYMVFADTQLGVALQTAEQADYNIVSMDNIHLFGETEADDCPKGHECYCKDKSAIMLSGGNEASKKIHIDSKSSLPSYKIKSYGVWNVSTNFNNFIFENFASNKTRCGADLKLFKRNPYSSDYIPIQKYTNTKFINVNDDAIAYLDKPDPGWANKDDCGPFPCTAPNNIVMQFQAATFDGERQPNIKQSSFQIISNVTGMSELIPSCKGNTNWNAYICYNQNLGVLYFSSMDGDWEDRSVQPVYVSNDLTGASNTLNSMMDHMWDGFYTGQKHKSDFPSMIEAKGNWTVTMTGTPPQNMKYQLIGGQSSSAVKIHVPYWNLQAGSYNVRVGSKDATPVPYNAWDKVLGRQGDITFRKGCGENRFVGVQNYLEFVITPGCNIFVTPVDSITGGVRLSWTLNEFYASGGVVSFTDRVAFALGIHASQIKVVAVYEGSVWVQYIVSVDKEDKTPKTTLFNLNNKLNTLYEDPNAQKVFGAPVMQATANSGKVFTPASSKSKSGQSTANKSGLNNAIFNNQANIKYEQVTVVIQRPDINGNEQGATVQSAATADNSQEQSQTQMYIIVGVLCGIILIVGFALLTFFLINKKNKATKTEKIDVARSNDQVVAKSEVDLDAQYHPQDINDLDIFAVKDKISKQNLDQTNNYDTEVAMHSNQKLNGAQLELQDRSVGADQHMSQKKLSDA